MSNFVFDPKAIAKAIINLEELDGKQVVLKVAKNEDWITLAAYDGEKTYIILHQKEIQ